MRQQRAPAAAVPASLLVHPIPAPHSRLAPSSSTIQGPTAGQVLWRMVKLGLWCLAALPLGFLSLAELQILGKLILCGLSSAIALYASVWLLLLFGGSRLRWTGA